MSDDISLTYMKVYDDDSNAQHIRAIDNTVYDGKEIQCWWYEM